MKPDVSIITPYYDEPLWMLKRNIKSITNQITDYNIEHIIVIDNPDARLEIFDLINRYANTYFFRHTKNKGLSAARNTALKVARGEYIMLLDTDDSFAVWKVQEQIDFMERENLDHSYGGYTEIHGNSPVSRDEIIMPPEFSLDYLLDFNNICYCGSNCFKKEVYDQIGGFDKLMKDGAEDLEYWIRIATNGYRVGLLHKVLYYLGIHGNNMTARYVKEKRFEKAYEYIRQKYPNLKFTT